MRDLILSRTTAIWIFLFAATAASWEMGHGLGFQLSRHASVAIIVVAFIKVRLVILEFMEVRDAPYVLRAAAEIWLIAMCSTLTLLYLRSAA